MQTDAAAGRVSVSRAAGTRANMPQCTLIFFAICLSFGQFAFILNLAELSAFSVPRSERGRWSVKGGGAGGRERG